MRKIVCLLALLISMFSTGCKIDEQAFYVEHFKVPPEAPKCVSTISDPNASAGLLDIGFRESYGGYFQVSNHLLARESYENSTAESNGIIIDGMEVYVHSMGGQTIGSTEYFQFETFLEPETTGTAFGLAIPESITTYIAEEYGCPSLRIQDNPDIVVAGPGQNVDVDHGSVYSVVRFIGHTQGDVEVETPEFTFPIDICCGCLVDWTDCLDVAGCGKYCEAFNPDHGMCVLGVQNSGLTDLYDCRQLYSLRSDDWCSANCAAAEEPTK